MTLFPLPGFMKPKGPGYCTEYQNLLDYWDSIGATPPFTADAVIQNTLLKALVDESYFAESELINIFGTPTADSSLTNWHNPGTFNPSLVNAPGFSAYGGYKGASVGTKYVRLNFNSTTNASLISQNNICVIVGVSDSVAEDRYDFGGKSGTTYNILQSLASGGISGYQICNCAIGEAKSITNNAGNKYHIMSRGSATEAIFGHNGYLSKETSASNGIPNIELYACGYNNAGSATISNRRVRCILILSYLVKWRLGRLIDILEGYFTNYGVSLINNIYALGDISTKQQITVPTSIVGNDEVIHPSVLDLGVAWNGYRYWQANTPYPNSDITKELPEIYGSNDGINWTRLTNPLFPAPGYSDPDLYYEAGKLYMSYRYDVGASQTRMIESTDGITWNTGSPVTIYNDGVINFSQSIVKSGATYYMYYKNYTNGKTYRVSCSTINGTYNTVEEVKLGVVSITAVNHLSVIIKDGLFYLAVGKNTGIYVYESVDGVTFAGDHLSCPTVYYNKSWEGTTETTVFYRPDLVEIDGELWCYYSVHAGAGLAGNYMGRIKINIL